MLLTLQTYRCYDVLFVNWQTIGNMFTYKFIITKKLIK
jgi:hypothetical protein